MAAPSVDKIVESFENPSIPLIDGEPTYTTLQAIHDLLKSNAASVTTNLGCSTLRLLCLTLSPSGYATLSTTLVVPPHNTGATPVIPEGATGPEAASICYTHDTATLAFNNFKNVDHALRFEFRRLCIAWSVAYVDSLWIGGMLGFSKLLMSLSTEEDVMVGVKK